MKKIWSILVYLFASFGFLMLAGFLAVSFGFSDVSGQTDENSDLYNDFQAQVDSFVLSSASTDRYASTTNGLIGKIDDQINILEEIKSREKTNLCKIFVVSQYADYNAKNIFNIYKKYASRELLDQMIFALQLKQSMPNFDQQVESCKNTTVDLVMLEEKFSHTSKTNVFVWQDSEHWQIIREGLIRDQEKIKQAAEIAQVDAREIVSIVIVEQLRLYYTQRELFEKVFKPLKILASANKMAWGIMAIKEKTAIQIEENLKNLNSPYYLGPELEHTLDFKTSNLSGERYSRLTSERDHFYSYLYGALYIKQIETQWQAQGFDISGRPEIIATIFNIGFKNSIPKEKPLVGGSTMNILGQSYTFGGLAHEFYYSGEMEGVFPF